MIHATIHTEADRDALWWWLERFKRSGSALSNWRVIGTGRGACIRATVRPDWPVAEDFDELCPLVAYAIERCVDLGKTRIDALFSGRDWTLPLEDQARINELLHPLGRVERDVVRGCADLETEDLREYGDFAAALILACGLRVEEVRAQVFSGCPYEELR